MKYPNVDTIYQKTPPDKIPWNIETIPEALVDLVQNGTIRPCKTIDLGCGIGTYAMYLAGRGFDVTGVDSSPTAVKIARKKAQEQGSDCKFIVADLLGDMHEVREKYDFAFEWEFLPQVYPEDREKYIGNILKILKPGAVYLSVGFSDADPQFGGSGKYRPTPAGTTLYFSSESEIRELFSPHFAIRDLKTIEVRGKFAPHQAIYALCERC